VSGANPEGGNHRGKVRSVGLRERGAFIRLTALGVVLIAVLVAVGFGVAALVTNRRTDSGRPAGSVADRCAGNGTSASVQPAIAVVVGPAVGVDVPSYVQDRRSYLDTCAAAVPDRRAVAVVSLAGYANPTGAAAVIGQVSVLAVYVELPVGGPLAVQVPRPLAAGANQGPSLTGAYATLLGQVTQARTAPPADIDQERTALEQGCGCVYGMTVAAPFRTLASLAKNQAVRLVDVAPPGFEPDRISARPVLPTELGTAQPGLAPSPFAG